ncbi:hypothetical protein MBLNU459_g8178t1 [Dothideomycetes sp. NU459]
MQHSNKRGHDTSTAAANESYRKRSRTSPLPDEGESSTSSTTSSIPSVSEASAMRETPPLENARGSTSVSSLSESDVEFDSSDYVSSESEEEDDSDLDSNDTGAEEDHIVTIGGPTKPAIRKPKADAFDLKAQLAAFLPQLAAANLELEKLRAAGELEGARIDNVDENAEGGYIEMNLGLGVLEQKKDGEDEEEDEAEEDQDGTAEISTGLDSSVGKKEKDVLGRMMGFKNGRQGAGIEEVAVEDGR